jgi:hypothetical protein
VNAKNFNYWNFDDRGDGMAQIGWISKEVALFHRDLAIWEASALQDYADKKWAIQRNYLDELIRQQQCQQWIAWLSPSEIFGQTTNALSRTDMQSFLKYMESVRNYRETFFRYYADKKLFELFAYFTGTPFEYFYSEEEIEAMGDKYREILNERDISSLIAAHPYLDTDDVPRYVSQPITLATVLNGAMGRLTALIALMVALLMATIAAFMKYDVR